MDKYFVVFHRREWIVKHGAAGFEAYPSRKAAIAAALEQANRLGVPGVGASVVVQGDGEMFFRTEWTSAPERPPLQL